MLADYGEREEVVTRCKVSHRYLTGEFGVSTVDDRY